MRYVLYHMLVDIYVRYFEPLMATTTHVGQRETAIHKDRISGISLQTIGVSNNGSGFRLVFGPIDWNRIQCEYDFSHIAINTQEMPKTHR